jgi:hypothetical protein
LTRKRKDRERRKFVRLARRQAKARPGKPRIRRHFEAKARPGDAVKLDFEFSGNVIPIDERRPVESLKERSEAIQEWEDAGRPTEGEA